ncbi:MAG: hybrid sensor histidine kinase/response regulator [Deltaproteobacteria bacterium]|nr:hybrid sensor histidine kinase/response regulator [Deltaproteobacteria bacterium]
MRTSGQIDKILLVDDEQDIREVIEISLSGSGYTVFTAENGKQALDIFKKEKPLIVLTDIKMPGMSGIDLLRKIKNINPDTEVIIITGHGDTDLAIKSLKYEAIDFITKPISYDALQIALKRANDKIITRCQLEEYTNSLEILLREKTELQDHLSSLGIMIGSISHGIKGLLTRLDGGVYLMESAYENSKFDEIGEGLSIFKETVNRIKKMVLDILYSAKERKLKLEKINVAEFAADVAVVIEQKIEKNKIEFHRDFGSDDIECEMDAKYIHSALINILDNAVDACLADKTKSSHKIVFKVDQDNGNLIFEIKDSGIGMDLKTREKIFNLFYSSKGSKGTGFGLFITDSIIKQHHGRINLNSAIGKGTHFNIKIPKHHTKKA